MCDWADTKPEAGLMENSAGLTESSSAAKNCPVLLDMWDKCCSKVTLEEPSPSPRIRIVKFKGTQEVLETQKDNDFGNPAQERRKAKFME